MAFVRRFYQFNLRRDVPCKRGKAEEAVCFINNFERYETGFPVVVPNDKRKPDELGRYFKGSTGVLCESKGL